MSNYASLKSAIQQVIKTNGNNEITGALLQQSLLSMINSLGFGYQFAGIATPTTNPGTPDQKVFYIASTPGTYSNFGGLALADGEIAILKYNGAWSKDSIWAASAAQLNQLGQKIGIPISLEQGGITTRGSDANSDYAVRTGKIDYNAKIATNPGYYIRGWYKYKADGTFLDYAGNSSINWETLDASNFISGDCAYYRIVFHKQNDSATLTPNEDIIKYFGTDDSILRRIDLLSTDITELQTELETIHDDVENTNSELTGIVKILSSDLIQGYYYEGRVFPNNSRVRSSSDKYYLIPEGKKVIVDSTVTGFDYRLTLYDASKNYITGSDGGSFGNSPIDVSQYTNAVYFKISIRKIDGTSLTPADCENVFSLAYPFEAISFLSKNIEEEINSLRNSVQAFDKKVSEELFLQKISSSQLVQGSYYGNTLTVNSKRVSCDEFLPINPGTTSLEVIINNSALTGGFRFILYDNSKNYITGSGTGNAAHGPYDISSWPTAKYYKFSYFNDTISGGSGSDITPEGCDGAFSVVVSGKISALQAEVSLIKDEISRIEDNLEIINSAYEDEAIRVTAEVEASNTDLRLLVFTDPHSFEKYKYLKYAQVNRLGGIDGVLGLGDYQNYVDADKQTCLKGITDMLNAAGRGRNCFYAVGNHDASCCLNAEMNRDGYKVLSQSNILTKKESWRAMQYHLNGIVQVNEADPYGAYFYIDFVPQKIRLIVLNASDIYEADGSLTYKYNEGVMIKQAQFTWLAEKALDLSSKDTPSEWSVLVAAHWWFNGVVAVLNAAKNGTRVNGTYSYTSRFTYNSETHEWGLPLVSESVTIDKDFSTQGHINVIGYLYGHTHCDVNGVSNDINILQFVCDNGGLNNMWKADLPSGGLSAGSYYFAMESGRIIQVTLTESYPNAVIIGYNHYFNNTDWTEVFLYDSNGQVIYKKNCQETLNPQGTEITGFTDAETTLVSHEKCCVLCVNKDTRKIVAYPYGSATYREISY